MKGLMTILLFFIIAALIEYCIVLYAINLDVEDTAALQWNAKFPATDWAITITISPLFHLVPLAVIITLMSSWIYLTRHAAVRRHEKLKGKTGSIVRRGKESKVQRFFGKVKSGLLRLKGLAYLSQKIHPARTTIKSAVTILLAFSALIMIVSLLAYPKLIYQTISSAYLSNPGLLDFVKGSGGFFASVGGFFSGASNVVLTVAIGFRDFAVIVGGVIKPLVELDGLGKYLVFQNAAAWVSALAVLFYGEFVLKSYRYRR